MLGCVGMSGLRNTKLLFNVSSGLIKIRIAIGRLLALCRKRKTLFASEKAKKRISWLKICRKGSITGAKRNRFVMLKRVRAVLKAGYQA